jgi:ketosteroid isomerase-like protein
MTEADSMNQLADKFFSAIERVDGKAIDEIYTPDAVVWHNYDNIPQSRADNMAMLARFPQMFQSFKYTDIRRSFYSGGFVQQHVARGTKTNGKHFDLFACMIITVRGNKIARIDEYFDSGQDPR